MMQNFVLADVVEFAQISDVHYSLKNNNLDKYLYFLSLSIKKKNPNFVVFLGDNVDKSEEENVIGFMRAIHSINAPYYVVFGQSDSYKLGGIEKETYLDIVTTFNRNQNENEKYYYFKPNKDVIGVVLDDTSDFIQTNHGEISQEQIDWLETLLKKNSKKLFLIFQHSPLLPPRIEYKLSMFNTEKYEAMLKKYSNVILISSGHYHQEAVQEDENGIKHISAPAFKDFPCSYQLIKIMYDKKRFEKPTNVEVIVERVKV